MRKVFIIFGVCSLVLLTYFYFGQKQVGISLNTSETAFYEVTYEIESEITGGDLLKSITSGIDAGDSSQYIDGLLMLSVAGEDLSGYYIDGLLYPDAKSSADLNSELNIPFKFKWLRTGGIEFFEIESTLDENRFVLADILRQFEVSFGSGRSWVTTEKRRFGNVEASYASARHWLTRILTKKVNTETDHYTVSSDTQYDFFLNSSFPKKVVATRSRQFAGAGGSISKDTLYFELNRTKQETVNSLVNVSIKEPFKDDLEFTKTNALIKEAALKEKMDLYTPEALKIGIDLTEGDQKKLVDYALVLYSYLKVSPDEVKDIILSGLATYDWDDNRFGIYSSSLAYIGNEECQKILSEAIFMLSDFRKVGQLMFSLGIVDQPVPVAYETFNVLSSDQNTNVAKQADLMLGVLVSNSYAAGVTLAEAEDTKDYLVSRLETSREVAQTTHYLDAVGNMGAAVEFSVLEQFLQSTDPKIKSEAIDALRLSTSMEAHQYLSDALRDENAGVRLDVATALTYQKGSDVTYQTIKERIFEESNSEVVRQLVDALVRNSEKRMESVSVLEDFLENCGKTELCNYVESVLVSLK